MMLTHLPRVGRVFHQPRLQLVELLPHFGRTRFVDRLIDATIGVGEVVDRPAYRREGEKERRRGGEKEEEERRRGGG